MSPRARGAPAAPLFVLALRLFPRWFRDRYGQDMVEVYLERAAEIRKRSGALAAALYRLKAFAEIPGAAWHTRWHESDPSPGRRPPLRSQLGEELARAIRSLARAPRWTAAALAILTLGIGGTTAVFSVVNGVVLRPLPYASPASLVSLWTVNQTQDLRDGSSWENARSWLEESRSLADVALVMRPEFTTLAVSSGNERERVHVGLVSANFFELLGVRAIAGRVFGKADLDTDPRVAVIDEGLWTTEFGADPGAVGRTITIEDEEFRIVGVVGRDVTIPRRETGVWRLYDPRPPAGLDTRGFDGFWVIGRMSEGVTPRMAQRELEPIAARLAREHPRTNRGRGVRVTALHGEIVGERIPLLLWTLFGAMALVLAIASLNVAQLMLSRGIERRRDIALRMALGASRGRLLRQLVLESSVLCGTAALGALLLAHASLPPLLSLIPPDVPLTEAVRVDGRVLLLTIGASALIAPLIGLLPALLVSRTNAPAVLRAGGRGSTRADRRLRSVLVVAEVAVAFVLLAGAGLLLRSAQAIRSVDPGFDARHTLIARVHFRRSAVQAGPPNPFRMIPSRADRAALLAERTGFQSGLLRRIRQLPGVVGAGGTGSFFIERIPDMSLRILGDPPRDSTEPAPRLTLDWVTPELFAGLGVPLIRGRQLLPADARVREETVLVNQEWVETFARGRDPVGLQFVWGDGATPISVVGVVGDVRRTTLEEVSFPQMFAAGAGAAMDLLVRASGDPIALVPAVREAVRAADPEATLSRIGTVWEHYNVDLAPRNFQTLLVGVFAGLATLLSAIGLFTILHDAVLSRRREIGIRLALGGSPAAVRGMVLRQGLSLAAAGLVLGLLAIASLSRVLTGLVHGITSTDPPTLAGVATLLILISVLASLGPALLATRVPPSDTLAAD